jgi:hypothetical protein
MLSKVIEFILNHLLTMHLTTFCPVGTFHSKPTFTGHKSHLTEIVSYFYLHEEHGVQKRKV